MTHASTLCASCGSTLRPESAFCPACGTVVHPRLNPFVFPMETDSRFWLLVIAVAGASILVFSMLYNAVPANWEAFQAAEAQCKAQQAAAQARGDVTMGTVFAQCKMSNDRERALWILGGLAILFMVASAIFFAIPRLTMWRNNLRPLGDKPAGLRGELAALCEAAGVRPAPSFVQSHLFRGARAFGWRGRYCVAMGRSLANTCETNPAHFRAVMRHELAHLRNADVEKTYSTIALCAAFGIVGILPLAIMLLDNPLALTFGMGWRVVALAALVALVGASVLRARETYADLRASTWDGPDGALREVLGEQAAHEPLGWWHPLRLHPAPKARRAAVDDTAPLFEMSMWEAFGAGVASTVALINIALLLVDPLIIAPLLQWEWATLLLGLIASLLPGPFVVGVVGVGIWRATFAGMAGHNVCPRAGWLAAGLGVGMLIGLKLSPVGALFEQLEEPGQWLALAVFDAVWCVALIACLVVVLAWAAESAEAWLPIVVGRSRGSLVPRRWLVACGGLLALVLGSFTLAYLLRLLLVMLPYFAAIAPRYVSGLPASPGMALALVVAVGLLVLVINPATTLALTAMWAYPLAASRAKSADTLPDWTLLDPAPAQPFVAGGAPDPRLIGRLSLAAAGALCAIGLVLALLGASQGLLTSDAISLIVLAAGAVSIPMQVAVALIAARRAPCLPLVHGLGAAGLMGAVLAIVGVLLLSFFGVLPPPAALLLSAIIYNGGGVSALAAVCGVMGASKLFGRAAVRPATDLQQVSARS
ncbi:MAG TPA: M48 family metalloprotease [Roseiflexaceae bacterium]|nr:M48 family metalloprotease [Roseiflexaceae bacterium]